MAQGKKYGDDVRERAYALLSTGDNVQRVAKKLKLPYSTVNNWKIKWENDASDSGENLEKVRNKNKEKFVNKAWSIITNSATLAERRVNRALYFEERIDAVAEEIEKHHEQIERETGTTWEELVSLVKELKNLKTLKLGELFSGIGVMYDKQALINKEPTGVFECKKFEDFN